MCNYKKCILLFILCCFISFFGNLFCSEPNGTNVKVTEPNDPNQYIPLCKVPNGYLLRQSFIVKSAEDKVVNTQLTLSKDKKNLIVKKIDRSSKKENKNYCDSVQEFWNKDKEYIDIFKYTCPDKETLNETIQLVLFKLYAMRC
jgi:hypothetical protein